MSQRIGKLTLDNKDDFTAKWTEVTKDFVIKTNKIPKEEAILKLINLADLPVKKVP